MRRQSPNETYFHAAVSGNKRNGGCDSSAHDLVIECILRVFWKASVNLRNAHRVMGNKRHGFDVPLSTTCMNRLLPGVGTWF